MSADIIQSQYEQLASVAQCFGRSAQANTRLTATVQRSMAALQGNWVGKGSDAFFSEMSDKVLPGLRRLTAALEESAKITRQMIAVLQAAETDAAAPFDQRADAGVPINEGGAVDGGGAAGGTGGGSGGFLGGAIDNLGQTFKIKAESAGGKPQVGVELFSGSFFNGKFLGDYGKWDVAGGVAGLGAKQVDGSMLVGAMGEIYGARVKTEGTLVGDQNFGWTLGGQVKALSAKGYAGYHDGSIGAEAGVNLVSVRGETGANIAGANIGVSGEIGLKLELGLSVGKHTTVKLGPFTVGVVFGRAKP